MRSPSEVKKDIPFLSKYSYWESTAVGPTLKPVIDSMVDYYENRPFNFLVGDCQPALEVNAQIKKACQSISGLINADPEEVSVYPKNTTESIAMVIEGFPLEEGDEVIGSNLEHMASYIPILRLVKKKRVKFKMVKADPNGMIDVNDVERLLTPKTKLIKICHASNIFGTMLDVRSICSMARSRGIATMLDSAQTVGRAPVDVKEIGCDFLNLVGRKHLCGPQGTAALYVRKEMIETLEPVMIGGGAARLISDYEYELFPGMLRHNAGILNSSGIIGLGKAVDYWREIGIDNIRRQCLDIWEYLCRGISDLGAVIYGSRKGETQAGIISFRLNGIDPDFLSCELEKQHRIIIRSGSPGSPVFKELGVDKINRMAPHYYFTKEDADKLLGAMKEIRDKA